MIDERIDTIIERLGRLEKEMKQVSNRLQCTVKKEELKLSEKLHVHDHAKNLEAQFEDLMSRGIPNVTVEKFEKELRDIIKYLVALVDNALGVKP